VKKNLRENFLIYGSFFRVRNVRTFNFLCMVCPCALIIHYRKFFTRLIFAA